MTLSGCSATCNAVLGGVLPPYDEIGVLLLVPAGGRVLIAIIAVEPERKVHKELEAENLLQEESVNPSQALQGQKYSGSTNHD